MVVLTRKTLLYFFTNYAENAFGSPERPGEESRQDGEIGRDSWLLVLSCPVLTAIG